MGLVLNNVIRYCIRQRYFSLVYLNEMIINFPYLSQDKVDKPSVIPQSLEVKQTICAPVLHNGHVLVMNYLIRDYLNARQEFLPDITLKPKEHYMLHYATQTKMCCPLEHNWTMRFEAKHHYFTKISNLNKCHRNICYSFVKRHQMSQVLHPVDQNLLHANVEVCKGKLT